ncbi:MAG: TetR/AcrR family transcriptional regulator [Bacteroidales bacterium]|nr:TetR/AcrR family transcriptional regulator [Bacteroidales bacterium]MDD4292583.1 TetR/AcrR family transcriptional regulator [Bacteroidales bacterium]MDD4491258.1 TetR/AcrR family transcriptional regulator [Bacteroidales bacterium]
MNITSRQLEIIESAGKILTVSGVSGLTIKNLAKEMNFSESAIYRHFPSKEKIIITMLNYLADSIDERLLKTLNNPDNTEGKFKSLFRSQINYFKNNPHFVVAVFSDGLLEESQQINETIKKLMATKIKHLMPIIIEGQKNGLFTNNVKSEELTNIVMGTFRMLLYKWRVENFQSDIMLHGENMVNSILSIIKVNPRQ